MAAGTNGPPVLNGSAYVYPEETLAQLRVRIITRLGYAAQLANPPPGVVELVDDFLQDAHKQLYKRYPTLRQQKWWQVAITQGERFYDVPYDGAYLGGNDISVVSGSPDQIETVNGDFVAAGFTNGMVININGSDSNDGFHTIATVGATVTTLTTTTTVTAETAGNLITVREQGGTALDLREITYVGMVDGTTWDNMIEGITPTEFTNTSQQRPTHYDIREFIEVFPEPDKAYTMYFMGRVALRPFSADTDVTTTDPHPVFLQALAMAKRHYGQPDASDYFQMLTEHLGSLNANSFGMKRYIPEPNYSVSPLPYPEVTGTGWNR